MHSAMGGLLAAESAQGLRRNAVNKPFGQVLSSVATSCKFLSLVNVAFRSVSGHSVFRSGLSTASVRGKHLPECLCAE